MYYFTSDYTEGCTPEILEALAATNFEQTGGYGTFSASMACVYPMHRR